MLKAQKDPAPWVITANNLETGSVVFYDGHEFGNSIADARLYEDALERDNAMDEALRSNTVVDVFYFGVTTDNGGLAINRLREHIRSMGPTIPYGVSEHVSL